jgi:hypothetical protein
MPEMQYLLINDQKTELVRSRQDIGRTQMLCVLENTTRRT